MEFSKHFRSHVRPESPDWTYYEATAHAMRASYLGELAVTARRGVEALVRAALERRRSNSDGIPSRWTGGNGGL